LKGRARYDDSNICVGAVVLGEDACAGDSGGPLVTKVNGEEADIFEQIGIVSGGDGRCVKRQKNHTAEIKEAFFYADRNGDNFVGQNEFVNFFFKFFSPEAQAKLPNAFKEMDKDQNGKLDFSEFLEFTKESHFFRERGQDEPMYFGRVVFALSWIHEKIDTSGVFCARQ